MMTPCETTARKGSAAPNFQLVGVYGVFLSGTFFAGVLIAEGAFSFVLTLGTIMQCLAFVILVVQVISVGCAGVSARSLALDAFALCCKLSSTTWLNGYLPLDASGDYMYQLVDGLSLVMVLWLLRQVILETRKTGDDSEDTFPAVQAAGIVLALGALLHANLNDRPLFDTLWMTSIFAECVSVMPQLWLITRSRVPVESLTSHFIAAMALGRVLSGVYFWHAHADITCSPYIGDFNHAGWAVLAAQLVHLVLLADFAYYYGKTVLNKGLNYRMDVGAFNV